MENSWLEKTFKGGVNIKISVKSVYVGIMLILLYHAVFVRFPYLYIQRIIVIILFMLIFPEIRFRRKDMSLLFMLGIYSVLTLVSSFLNKDNYVYTHTLVGGLFHAVMVFEILQVFMYALKVRGMEFVIQIFLFLSFMYVLLNDILVIFYPRMFGYEYLVGNKFLVSYKHIELITLYCMGKRKNIFVLFGIFAISFYMSAKVNCMTGAVGLGILGILLFVRAESLLQKRQILCGVMGISGAFPFVYDFFTGIYPIQYFIVNILHRTRGMTGRTVIFDYLPLILKNHLFFGYGYNTSYEVWIGATDWYPNAQNGFWNCVCEQGIICAVLLVMIAVYVTGLKGKSYYPLICMIYVYAILGTVEITMDITFIAWLLFLYTAKRGDNNYQRDNTRLQRGKIHFRVH